MNPPQFAAVVDFVDHRYMVIQRTGDTTWEILTDVSSAGAAELLADSLNQTHGTRTPTEDTTLARCPNAPGCAHPYVEHRTDGRCGAPGCMCGHAP